MRVNSAPSPKHWRMAISLKTVLHFFSTRRIGKFGKHRNVTYEVYRLISIQYWHNSIKCLIYHKDKSPPIIFPFPLCRPTNLIPICLQTSKVNSGEGEIGMSWDRGNFSVLLSEVLSTKNELGTIYTSLKTRNCYFLFIFSYFLHGSPPPALRYLACAKLRLLSYIRTWPTNLVQIKAILLPT